MRAHARWTLVILIAFMLTLVPAADVSAHVSTDTHDDHTASNPTSQPAPIDGPEGEPAPPPPPSPDIQLPVVPPITPITIPDGKRSSLHIVIVVNPDPITVGETAVISLTVVNNSSYAAEEVQLRLPMPVGTGLTPTADAALLSPQDGWLWNIGHIDGNDTVVVTASLRVDALPPGEALVVRPAVNDRDLDAPMTIIGGALVLPAPTAMRGASTTGIYQPGRAATLRSRDNKVAVMMQGGTAKKQLRIDYSRDPATILVPDTDSLKSGLTPFSLTATDAQGKDTHTFSDTLTVAVRYSPEQLLVRGIAEGDLQLYYFDDRVAQAQQGWIPIETSIDTTNHVATAQVDHFTVFKLGDGALPSEAFIPSVKAWQVSLFTGSATYQQSLDVPAGPGGIKPDIALSYNSAATDGLSGMRREHQASWVGKGWSLDTGAVSRNKILRANDFFRDTSSPNPQPLDTFSLVFNGQSIDVVRGERNTAITSTATYEENAAHLDLYHWRSTDETFVRIEVVNEEQDSWNYDDSPSSGVSQGITYEHDGALLNKYGRGGKDERFSEKSRPRYSWRVWTKDGMKYEFKEDLWYGWHFDTDSNTCRNIMEQYKWLLSSITDTHGNTIIYDYNRRSWVGQGTCEDNEVFRGTVDVDAWPVSVTWGAGSDPSNHRYRIRFLSSVRPFDILFKPSDVQYTIGDGSGVPREMRRLDEVVVESRTGASWKNVRSYLFEYASQQDSMTSDYSIDDGTGNGNAEDPTTPKITLTGFQLVGNDRGYNYAGDGSVIRDGNGNVVTPGTALPKTRFTYGRERGTGLWAIGDWNRLKLVDNGQGGKVGFQYVEVESSLPKRPNASQVNFGGYDMGNYRRVIYRNTWDGLNETNLVYPTDFISTTADYKSRFLYEKPQLNSSGMRGGDNEWAQVEPNSAILYYNSLIDGDNTSDDGEEEFLFHRNHSEFRGHAVVTEIDPTGAKIRHTFHQGDIENCAQTKSGTDLNSSSLTDNGCFLQLRDREFLKGKPRRTEWYASEASTTPLRWVNHTYDVSYLGAWPLAEANMMRSGQWRAWSRETTIEEGVQEGTTTTRLKKTQTTYESTYGNPIQIDESIDNALKRSTRYTYNTLNTGQHYIVDRPSSKRILAGNSAYRAMTYYLYDNRTTTLGLGDSVTGRYDGNLTLQRVYSNVPDLFGATVLDGKRLYSTDTSYSYDSYGNQTAVTTYDGPGTVVHSASASVQTFSAPGNGTPSSATTTHYDTLFNSFPITHTQTTGTGVALTQVATWDYHMATLKNVMDANGHKTFAFYDVFGRMFRMWKPGDTISAPTAEFVYEDGSVPFVYRINRREVSASEIPPPPEGQPGPNVTQPTYVFYDGLGRQIQTKKEAVDGARMIVTDMSYDGLDRMTAQSTPRYVDAPGLAFSSYTTSPAVSCTSGAWTCTSYDALGRPYDVKAPDGALTTYRYGINNDGMTRTVTDANNHQTVYESDMFERLTQVTEYSGTGDTNNPFAAYAITLYAYNALDLLTHVQDAKGNVTAIGYDSAGRKKTMHDPDMGDWAYTYDVAGNLVAQTDAKNQTTLFGYDDLNRMTSKLAMTHLFFSDTFTTKDSSKWNWSAYQTVVVTGTNSVIKSTGPASGWDATFERKTHDRSNRHGIQLRFNLAAANTEASFMLEADDTDPVTSPAHPRFAVVAGPNGALRVQSSDGTNAAWDYAELMPKVELNRWYVLMLGLDDDGGFTAYVHREGHPDQAYSYRTVLPAARGEDWRFRHYVQYNTVYIDDYREYTSGFYRYDTGTNGKGHRTSMASPGVTQSWNYDQRGRVVESGYNIEHLTMGGRNYQMAYDAADRVTSMTYPSGEVVNSTYDAAWRQSSLCSGTYSVCYADDATFDAQDQPYSWQLGNGLYANWTYYGASRRLDALKVGTTTSGFTSGTHVWNRYSYDAVGNVQTIREFTSSAVLRETQTFGYDHRDRLTSASTNVVSGTPVAYTAATYSYLSFAQSNVNVC